MTNTVLVISAIALAGCMSGPVAKAPESLDQDPSRKSLATPAAEPTLLTRVEPSQVCMVNNHFMGKLQIAVDVAGKTYFGCCEMCKSRLADDPNARSAIDPVSGAKVDKADSVIGKTSSGDVLYFESDANLKRYHASGS